MKNFKYSVEDVNRVLASKEDIEKIESQLEEVKAFEDLVSYLQQSKQYITDEAFRVEITMK